MNEKIKNGLIYLLMLAFTYAMLWPAGATFTYGVLGEKYYGDTWVFKVLSFIFPEHL